MNTKVWQLAALGGLLFLAGCGNSEPQSTPAVQQGDDAAVHNSHNEHGSEHGNHGSKADGEGEGVISSNKHEESGNQDSIQAVFSYSDNGHVEAKKAATISMQIQTPDGEPYDAFEIVHEKLMHLIIVSKDLSYFEHAHPEYKGSGKFEVSVSFPAAGEYKLIADFTLSGLSHAVQRSDWLTVQGKEPAPQPIIPDKEGTLKTVSAVDATLSHGTLAAGAETALTFRFSDAKTKKPIEDLQPYLGAIGHVVILSEDAEQFLHVHPLEEAGAGPEATFETTFPRSGIYKLWGQFQRGGQVFTVPFVVEVP
ncbi:hypothetical protein [Paenibacillus sp. NPDC058071]|uniref:hypothetical protein n=1 Tax=Paenibacillus sp. NPDC058071 TaxID=3346326 RepID=UPI0036DB96A3